MYASVGEHGIQSRQILNHEFDRLVTIDLTKSVQDEARQARVKIAASGDLFFRESPTNSGHRSWPALPGRDRRSQCPHRSCRCLLRENLRELVRERLAFVDFVFS